MPKDLRIGDSRGNAVIAKNKQFWYNIYITNTPDPHSAEQTDVPQPSQTELNPRLQADVDKTLKAVNARIGGLVGKEMSDVQESASDAQAGSMRSLAV